MRPRERYFAATWLITPLVLASFSTFTPGLGDSEASPTLTHHEPVFIDGNDAFTMENGVVGGNGTPGNPYIIDGWEISPENATGIHVRNTTAHFGIRNVSIVGPGLVAEERDWPGILLENVTHGHVVNATIKRVSSGIIVNSSSNMRLSASEISLTRLRMADFDSGIRIESSANITIADNIIHDTKFGLYVVGSADLSITGNDILGTGPGTKIDSSHNIEFSENAVVCDCTNRDALVIQFSSNLTLTRNKVFQNRVGIVFFYTENATLDANNITNNHLDGLALRWSRNFTLTRNIFAADGINLYGDSVEDYASHNISGDNLVNGRPVLAYNGCSDLLVDGANAGQVIVTNCMGAHISNLTIENTDHAILLAFTEGANVTGNQLLDTRHGVDVLSSSSVTVTQNLITGSWQGITVETSDGVVLRRNQLLHGHEGFRAGSSTRLRIESNEMRSNDWGGVVQNSSHILFIKNEVADTERVGLNYYNDVSNATAYHNNFTGSFPQVLDLGSNRWDDGYPSGGNQWHGYSGVDLCSGPNQDICPDPDGIGDTPYVIDADSRDRYPLTPPNTPPVASFTAFPSIFNATGTLFVDASSSSDAEDPSEDLEVRWDWEEDGSWDTFWSTVKTAEHRYLEPGAVTIRLQVRDSEGLSNTTTRVIMVGPNSPPTASFTVDPASGTVATVFAFDASSSADPEDPARMEIRWDFDNDGVWDTDWSTSRRVSHSYPGAGTFTIRLGVRDSGGLADLAFEEVRVDEAEITGPPLVPVDLSTRSTPEIPFRIAIPEGWEVSWSVGEQDEVTIDLIAIGPVHDAVQANIVVVSTAATLEESESVLRELAEESIDEFRRADQVEVMKGPSIVETSNSEAALFILNYPREGIRQVLGIIVSTDHQLAWVVVGTSAASLAEFYDPVFTTVIGSFEVVPLPSTPLPGFVAPLVVGTIIAAVVLAGVGVYLIRQRGESRGQGEVASVSLGSWAERAANGEQPAEATVVPKYCTNCGSRLRPVYRFCAECGSAVRAA